MPQPATDGPLARVLPWAATAWLVAAAAAFFAQTLPNNAPISRLDILTLQPFVTDAAFGFTDNGGLRFLGQRLPVFAMAAAVVGASLAVGDLILRRLDAVPSDRWLRVGLAGGLGLSGVSLAVLALGLAGLLNRTTGWGLLAMAGGAWAALRRRPVPVDPATRPPDWCLMLLAGCVPFVVLFLLGAALPSVDFDVREYHLQGPKEGWLSGRIQFLDHNVYTSFPFLTEMHSLLGMTLAGDWWVGALVGKVTLASFALLTAATLYGLGRRVDPAVGALAAAAWLTSPWCHRASTIAYAEGGLTSYVTATLAACVLAWPTPTAGRWAIAGLLAGSGMACKYPGLVQTVAPAGAACLASAWRLRADPKAAGRTVVAFTVGVAAAVGPWLAKNFVETGNPVYPLGYSVFGGRGHDDAWAAKWRAAHSPPLGRLTGPVAAAKDLVRSVNDAVVYNDWQTPLVLVGWPLGLLVAWRLRGATLIAAAGLSIWLFVAWWLLTHRIDRFWVPALPVWCLAAAAGLAWPRALKLESGPWRWAAGGLVVVSMGYHLVFNLTPLVGLNLYATDYAAARRAAARAGGAVSVLNEVLPADARPLLVGEAAVFEAEFEPLYNTVFDASIFQLLTTGDAGRPDAGQPTAPADEVCRRLREARVTHVFVNWSEVLRYRETYGYTDYVTPDRIDQLVSAGALSPVALPTQAATGSVEVLNDSTRKEIARWGPSLIRGDTWTRTALYRVVCD